MSDYDDPRHKGPSQAQSAAVDDSAQSQRRARNQLMQTHSGGLPPVKSAPPAKVIREADGSVAAPLQFKAIPTDLAEWAFLPHVPMVAPPAPAQTRDDVGGSSEVDAAQMAGQPSTHKSAAEAAPVQRQQGDGEGDAQRQQGDGEGGAQRAEDDDESWLDWVQGGLDAASLALDATGVGGAVSWVPDVANAGISAGRGDWAGAGLSMAAAIPFVGAAANATRLGRAAAKHGDEAVDLARRGSKAADSPRGGTYKLRDLETGEVRRTGRTKDLSRRRDEHAKDPETRDLEFEVDKHTDDYAQQRGREQILHERYPNADLNKIRAIDPKNPRRQEYLDAAKELE